MKKEFIDQQKVSLKDELIDYIKSNHRVCPQPQLWNKLWRMLKDRERVGVAGWKPPVPLILAAWWESSDDSKRQRLLEHIECAKTKGQLDSIATFIYNLKEEEWYHIRD